MVLSLSRRPLIAFAAVLISVPAAVAVSVAAPAHAAPAGQLAQCPWLNPLASVQQRVSELVAAMSLAQKISLMQPVKGGPYPGYEHYVPGIPSLCVPAVMQQDDSAGVAAGADGVTQLPAPIAAAATFDLAVLSQYGAVIGNEMRGKGIGFALAPTLNLDRVPQWGRTFETLGEDSYLTTKLGDADIEGIQSQGVIADVKHYAEYNQETNRKPALNADNVVASTRTMQETELAVFGSAVRDARAGGIMCAMPSVNGTGACQNAWLLGVLRGQYGFKGDIRSDNPPSVTANAQAAAASLDQAVAPYYNAADLTAGVQNGTISMATIDAAASQILYPMFQTGLFSNPPAGNLSDDVSTPAHVAFAQDAAEQGTVLLKNAAGALPLGTRTTSSIAVIGADAAAYAQSAGGGSGHVYSANVVTPLRGITDRAGPGVNVTYAMGSGPYDAFPDIPPTDLTGLTENIYPDSALSGTPAVTSTPATVDLETSTSPLPGAAPSDVWSVKWAGSVTPPVTGSYQFSLTCDRPCQLLVDGKLTVDDSGAQEFMAHHTATGAAALTEGQPAAIEVTYKHTSSSTAPENAAAIAQLGWLPPGQTPPSVTAAAQAAKNAQVAIVFAGTFQSEGFDQPNLNLSGVDDQLIEAVAKANPHTIVVLNTGGPVLMPWLNNVAAVVEAWYPGQQDGAAIASVLFGDTDPGGKLPVTFPASASQPLSADPSRYPGVNGQVDYSEGLDIGYKWYDAQDETPLFPFGYGLSYTRFSFSGLRVLAAHDGALVTARVTNTGSRRGTEVAQLYLGDPASTGEPARQLRGIQRADLGPGQSTIVTFRLTAQDLAYWNSAGHGWTDAPGTYRVWVGDSSAAAGLPLAGEFRVP
jgi:beta-glucosidase